MSQSQKLRVLVNERLSAAAEEIFALFEGTIVRYEEELSRSKEENKRKQVLLDSVLSPKVVLPRAVPDVSSTPESGLQSEISDSPRIKDEPGEHRIKQEQEEQLITGQQEPQRPAGVPELCGVYVKTEEPSLLYKEENVEVVSSNPDVRAETDEETDHSSDDAAPTEHSSDTDEEYVPPKTKPRLDHNYHNRAKSTSPKVQMKPIIPAAQGSDPSTTTTTITTPQPAPETSSTVVKSVSESAKGEEDKKHQCEVCKRRFSYNYQLQVHNRIHTGERPFSCTICNKSLSCQTSLDVHTRQHATKQSYSCPICNKVLSSKTSVLVHTRQHKGEQTFTCSVCQKTFAQMCILQMHMQTHNGDLKS